MGEGRELAPLPMCHHHPMPSTETHAPREFRRHRFNHTATVESRKDNQIARTS
jgi:hypothetical protein